MNQEQAKRLNEVFAFLVSESGETNSALANAITRLRSALQDGRNINREEALNLLDELWLAVSLHENTLHILNLLDVSGSEAALREVERIKAKRRNGVKKP